MKKSKVSTRKRMLLIFLLFILAFICVIGRLVYVQIFQGEELQAKAENLRTREVAVEAKRGTIYDRNGNILATSISADSVYAYPSQVSASGQAVDTATFLAEILGQDYDTIYKKITSSHSFEWIKRKCDFAVADAIEEANLPGIYLVAETQRYYPNGTLAANILGFAGIDNQGLEGLEIAYDDVLKGENGSILTEFDAHGQEIPQATKEYIAPTDGNSVVLTIDETIQYFCERELNTLMSSENPPEGATIIVMQPKTGEILAMANSPTYDPNDYSSYDSSTYRNRAVADVYEPGSTFKIMIAATALEEGLVNLNSTFYDPGYIMIGKTRMKCWRYYNPHGLQTFTEAVQNSCNVAFISIGLSILDKNEDLLYNYLEAFGFGQSTQISLRGEANGLMISREKLTRLNVANISIGQSIAVTPLQLITAVSAVANGGTLMQPQIVKEIVDKDGNVVEEYEPVAVRQVISAETSETLRGVLEKVVSQGTGRRAYIEGYRVGGKTGTAQKVAESGGYSENEYVVSFIGIAPCNDPELVVLVVIDSPSEFNATGGVLAAPIFKSVMEDSLRYLGVEIQVNADSIEKETKTETEKITVLDLSNLTKDEAISVLNITNLKCNVQGSGSVVVSQFPAGFSKVEASTTVVITLGDSSSDTVIVPDLTGYRVRAAAEILDIFGLQSKTSGSGFVTEQNPIPGTEVKKKSIVTVTFSAQEDSAETLGP